MCSWCSVQTECAYTTLDKEGGGGSQSTMKQAQSCWLAVVNGCQINGLGCLLVSCSSLLCLSPASLSSSLSTHSQIHALGYDELGKHSWKIIVLFEYGSDTAWDQCLEWLSMRYHWEEQREHWRKHCSATEATSIQSDMFCQSVRRKSNMCDCFVIIGTCFS